MTSLLFESAQEFSSNVLHDTCYYSSQNHYTEEQQCNEYVNQDHLLKHNQHQ